MKICHPDEQREEDFCPIARFSREESWLDVSIIEAEESIGIEGTR